MMHGHDISQIVLKLINSNDKTLFPLDPFLSFYLTELLLTPGATTS